MERNLRFAAPSAFIEIPPELSALKDVDEKNSIPLEILQWADGIAQLLDSLPSGVAFKIGKLRLPHDESRKIALRIAHLVSHALKSRGMPEQAFVEVDRIRPVNVWNHQVRTLFPHNDGAHCSYLTPSLVDDPSWDSSMRTFSHEHFSTTQAHKMYQGFFIVDIGSGISVTTYYDWLKILSRAYSLVSHKKAIPISELQHWLGQNIHNALENQPLHKNRYLSIGAALGSNTILYQGVVFHAAEEDLTQEERSAFPTLSALDDSNEQSYSWLPARARLLSNVLSDMLKMTWQEFRAQYEICVPGEQFDYLLAHNLVLLHGGLMGGSTRRLEPISIVLEYAEGNNYEKWLSRAWKRHGETITTP